MFDVAIDSDVAEEGDIPVGDFISFLTISWSMTFVLFDCSWCSEFCVCACSWTFDDDWKLFEVVTSDTWQGSRFICDKKGKSILH